MNRLNQPDAVSQGVQELIDEIREKGVNAGKDEGARIVADAESRAQWILAQAEEEAARLRQQAQQDAQFIRDAGHEALQLSMRDVLLRLRDEISQHLTHELESMIKRNLQTEESMLALLSGVAARLSGDAVPEAVLIPASVVGIDELRINPQALTEGALPDLLATVLKDLMCAGVRVLASGDHDSGVVLQYDGGTVTVELTEKVLCAALMAHLQPRFRAMLEGVVA
jgi:V/A-type H+-transporting ATPase subunit E